MVEGEITGRGILLLIKVPNNVKVNTQYYIENALKPYLETVISSVYPNEEKKKSLFIMMKQQAVLLNWQLIP